MSTNLLAARFVAASANDVAEAKMFLSMLGLVGSDGRIVPDDNRVQGPLGDSSPSMTPPVRQTYEARPKVSTAPLALRHLSPVQDIPKPKRVVGPRSAAQLAGPPQGSNEARMKPCGTPAAIRRHQRNGEPVCDVCQASRTQRKAVASAPRPVAPCGTVGAYERHRRHGETPCAPCQKACADRSRQRREQRAVCGTHAGHRKHIAEGTEPCQRCVSAYKHTIRNLRDDAHEEAKCGTNHGYEQHRRRNEPTCTECRTAHNTYNRARRNGQ